jgi:hypothetical protein
MVDRHDVATVRRPPSSLDPLVFPRYGTES